MKHIDVYKYEISQKHEAINHVLLLCAGDAGGPPLMHVLRVQGGAHGALQAHLLGPTQEVQDSTRGIAQLAAGNGGERDRGLAARTTGQAYSCQVTKFI